MVHKLLPIHDRHHHIQENETRLWRCVEPINGFLAVGEGFNPIPFLFQRIDKGFSNFFIVFDYKYFRATRFGHIFKHCKSGTRQKSDHDNWFRSLGRR